jgi:hypothetical protein
VNPTKPTDLSKAKWTVQGDSTKSAGAKDILKPPSVGKIGTASSAANAITANKGLAASFSPQSYFKATFQSNYPNPDNGVCTTPGKTCKFPSSMTMDGCYADNLGFALNVGYLQKKYPGKHLRLLGVTSDMCDRAKDPTCIKAVSEASFRSFFADSPHPTVEGWLPSIVPGPNRIIFKESITDAQAIGQQTGFGGLTFVTGTFTTVRNDHFGVAAGTKVTLLVSNINGPQYLQAQTTAQTAGLGEVAINSYGSWQRIMSTFEKKHEVDSSKAFLYYQTV